MEAMKFERLCIHMINIVIETTEHMDVSIKKSILHEKNIQIFPQAQLIDLCLPSYWKDIRKLE